MLKYPYVRTIYISRAPFTRYGLLKRALYLGNFHSNCRQFTWMDTGRFIMQGSITRIV